MASWQPTRCRCCVLLIKYILYNEVVIDYKLILFINYWRHDGNTSDAHVAVHRDKFLIIETSRCTNFSKFWFWNETLHVSDSPSVHYQEFFTVQAAIVYVIHVCWQLASRSICSCSQAVSKPVRYIIFLCVQWKTTDDGKRNYPKHVEFHFKIKILRN
jgi:hypothetical protein